MFRVSTMAQLVALVIFALILNLLGLNSMLVCMITFLLLLSHQKNRHFFRLTKRLRWLFLVMFLIFVFNTPGEHVVNWPYSIKPTYEGLQLGVKQVLRIALMLAAISTILARNTTQQLISGLYFIMRPLSSIGVDVKRFSVRLWLTLHYVELEQVESNEMSSLTKNLAERLNNAFAEDVTQQVEVTFEKTTLTWLDYAVVFLMLALFLIAFIVRGF